MSAIIAYFNSGGAVGTTDQERQNGGKEFGALLRTITGANVRDQLYDHIDTALNSNNYKLFFSFRNETGNATELEIEEAEQLGGDKIVLTLDKDGSTDGEVVLTVRTDRRENERKGNKAIKKRSFHMEVVFPESRELDGFSYLEEVAQDVITINDDEDGADYLTVFKLLSRCR